MFKIIPLIIFFIFSIFPVYCEEEFQINVLVIHSSSVELPWVTAFNKGIEEIRKTNFPQIHVFFEFMGKDFTGNSLNNDDWVFYLNSKYSTLRLDFIIAESADAVFLLSDNRELFLGTPKIMRSVFQPEEPEKMMLYISSDIKSAVDKTFLLAMKQNPDTENIVIIDGLTLQSENIIQYLNNVLSGSFQGSLRIISDFTVEEMLDEISLLDRNSLVFYTAVLKDRSKSGLVPRDVLVSVCEVSQAPVYTFWNTFMGTGIVGGCMLDAETVSREMFRAGMDYLQNGEFGDYYETLHTYLDWAVMNKFGLKYDDEDYATIINKPVSPLVLYYREIITVILFVSILVTIIAFIVLDKFKKLNSRLESSRSELQVLVEEKSLLIREIDHRVKNNLFILRELVELQMMNIDNPEIINDLREVSGRIGVMALVHEKLFKAETESLLDTRKYFEDLVQQIIKTMLTDSVLINVETDIQPVPINTRTAITCGLIINELLTNALKYAFQQDKGGSVYVIIRPVSDSFYEIVVKDNGRGLPPEFNPETGSGLGLKVVQRLTSQIHGKLQINSDKGTEFRLSMEIRDR